MGIKNLSQFLKKKEVYETLSIEELKYTKIAIDTPLYLYKFKCQTYDWLQSFIHFITFLRSWDIHPIFVFEGKAPIEKHSTQEYRCEQKVKIADKTNLIEEDFNAYIKTGEISPVLLETSNKLNNGHKSLLVKSSINHINEKAIMDLIERRRKYEVSISKKDIITLKILLKFMGVSYVQSKREAETDCVSMYYAGLVDYILSEDTDVLAYYFDTDKELIKVITKINTTNLTFTSIFKDNMLQTLNMSQESFRDFCIMCGTDYNKNIFRIGVEKSYKLIQQFYTIENVPLDTSILNHIQVRKIFTTVINDEILLFKNKIKWCSYPLIKLFETFIFMHNLKQDIVTTNNVINVLITPNIEYI